MTNKFILLLFFCISLLYAEDLSFFREDIDFKIDETYFYVDGIYYFQNNSDNELKRILFYPIPQDSLYGKVDSIYAVGINDSENKIVKINNKGAFFKVDIPPQKSRAINISYKHRLFGNKAEYILTTTKKWGKPLKEVNYIFSVPQKIIIDSLSYMPDSLKTIQNNHIFYYKKKNFMPQKNMIILFHQEEKIRN